MAEIPKLVDPSHGYGESSEQKSVSTQKISVSDHFNAFQYGADKTDSFVIDMDPFSSAINKDASNANSRITLQRSLSRKGSQRWGDRKVNGNATLHDKDAIPNIISPKGTLVGPCMSEKTIVGSTDHLMNPHVVHHQISGTAGNTESNKCTTKRNSFRRPSCGLDPKRVLLLFATLSSIGTVLLIYFTLTISKQNADQSSQSWSKT